MQTTVVSQRAVLREPGRKLVNPTSTAYQRRCHVCRASSPDEIVQYTALAQHVIDHMPLALEPLTLPCSTMNCGDLLHKSTLDPVLRMEQRGIDPRGVALLFLAALYLTAKPGVLQGFVDTYFQAALQRANSQAYSQEDVVLKKKLATGGFGTVYRAELLDSRGSRDVIVKKAKEFGEAEVWMNERMMRVAPTAIAEFITAFEEVTPRGKNNTLWLIWQYEGDSTLYDLMQQRNFPYNLEPLLFGRTLDIPEGPRRAAISIKLVMQQLLQALRACHNVGIVHRDIKPQNIIVSGKDRCIKLIDLGAAADLRIGINYVPNEFLLDPRYAPPQQYIMSTQTPRAPPAPVAALLSPILWWLNRPDRFDMYSAGMVLLQMSFPSLRSDNNLIAFNRRLQSEYNYNLRRWRRDSVMKGKADALADGFALLDMNEGAGWDLICNLIAFEPKDRLSARGALAHPWLGQRNVVDAFAASVEKTLSSVEFDEWLEKSMSGASRGGAAITEAEIAEQLFEQTVVPPPPSARRASNTIAWWKSRQSGWERKLAERRNAKIMQLGSGMNGASPDVSNRRKPLSIAAASSADSNGAFDKSEKKAGLLSKLVEVVSSK